MTLVINFKTKDKNVKKTCAKNVFRLCEKMERKKVHCFMIERPDIYNLIAGGEFENDTHENVQCYVRNAKSAYNLLKRLNAIYDYEYIAEIWDNCGCYVAFRNNDIENFLYY
jgi:hypothetical protein